MASKQSPHLPPRDHKKEKEFAVRAQQGGIVVLAALALVAAGAFGAWFMGRFAVDGVTVIERPVEVFVPQDPSAAVAQIDQKVLRGVLPVYTVQAVVRHTDAGSTLLSNALITAEELQGFAVALTSDGWVVSTADVITVNSVVRVGPGELLQVDRVIADPTTDLVFAKVDTDALTPLPFARITDDTRKNVAAIPTTFGTLRAMIINSTSAYTCAQQKCIVRDAAHYDEYGLASPVYDGVEIGHPLLTTHGEIIGIVQEITNDGGIVFIPADVISPVLPSVFTQNMVVRPTFGFTYVDLAQLTHTDPQVPTAGAYVMSVEDDMLDVVVGDVITAVNGVALTHQETLAHLIYQFSLGTTVAVQVLRDGEPMEIQFEISAQE